MFARRFWRLSGSIRGRALDLAGRGSLLFSSSQKKIKGFNTEDTERGTEGHGDREEWLLLALHEFQVGVLGRSLSDEGNEGRGGARQGTVAAIDEA